MITEASADHDDDETQGQAAIANRCQRTDPIRWMAASLDDGVAAWAPHVLGSNGEPVRYLAHPGDFRAPCPTETGAIFQRTTASPPHRP
jgi:hypothetical protein